MQYCTKCVQPDTRPGIFLDEYGVCSACNGHYEKVKKIDWKAREEELKLILERHKRQDGYYDCIIPVSGGKDSTYQVYIMKIMFGMNPLAVTYKYADRTPLGQQNLDNLRKLGVDHIEIAPNPLAEKKFIKKALIEAGDPCLPDHMGIFAAGLRVAINYKIPLIIWGENSQLEYGGSTTDRNNPYLDSKWLQMHGCLQGKSPEDWLDDELTLQEMASYRFPSDEEMNNAKLQSIFLGYYFSWDPVENYKIAESVGFQKSPDGPKMGLYDFADLDSTNIIVHHYIKWLKFGMTRLNDNISVEIRNGRMNREEGIELLKSAPERVPTDEVRTLCAYLEISEEEFWSILENFRNTEIWKKDVNGHWNMPDYLKGL